MQEKEKKPTSYPGWSRDKSGIEIRGEKPQCCREISLPGTASSGFARDISFWIPPFAGMALARFALPAVYSSWFDRLTMASRVLQRG